MKTARIHIAIGGAVQGVGFRPFVYRTAAGLGLTGFVLNNSLGVFIEAEGEESLLKIFLKKIEDEKPSLSVITSLEHSFLDPAGYDKFEIKESEENDETAAFILPDIAVCDDCLKEMNDPKNRRYRYPFINCTNCGPRFSIIEALPYDRPNTSMKIFKMCDECRKEYEDPMNRRFHAQPVACPNCGPHIFLWDENGNIIAEKEDALLHTAELIRNGKIVALKGLGGFQLIVDASNDDAVRRMRERKHREEKPFALMFPSLNSIKDVCAVSKSEQRVLLSPESPIVLLKRKDKSVITISRFIAPGNPYIGAMLPYTPLHHLLIRELNFPIVATSANLSEEPICIDETDALSRLNGIADYYLVNNRPIVRHVDDSIVRVIKNREMVLRRARGYAPLPLLLSGKQSALSNENILAVGGHLKNTVSLKVNDNIFISQHIGDLSTEEANKTFRKVIDDFQILYDVSPSVVISDLHPEYISTKYAKKLNIKTNSVQHHFAHIAACRLENQVGGSALGVSWDGTGYGTDGTIWGGEFFLSDDDSYKHIGQFRQFKLPGGEKAIKEPRRSLAGLLFEIAGESFVDKYQDILLNMFSTEELRLIKNMLVKNINSPVTSSAGRIFDAVSALLGICTKSTYEGQAAMMLEFNAEENETGNYSFEIFEDEIIHVNWVPIINEMINDLRNDVPSQTISGKFHNTLANIILKVTEETEEEKVILSGGCFQNVLLAERTIDLLRANDYKIYWHQRIPPNDGCISLGQIAAYIFDKKHSEKTSFTKLTKEVK